MARVIQRDAVAFAGLVHIPAHEISGVVNVIPLGPAFAGIAAYGPSRIKRCE